MPDDLMSLRGYAKQRGVSLSAVQDAIRRGVLYNALKVDSNGNKKIHPKIADEEWANNANPSFYPTSAANGAQVKTIAPPFQESRAIREAYNARITKLEYEEKLNKIISIEKVKAINWDIARRVRDSILVIPSKISAEIASETDPHKVESILLKEIREALTEIGGQKDVKTGG